MRDFVQSRVVGGQQRIRAHISFHTAGQLVLWPYAYTRRNLPPDMTELDLKAFRRLGTSMARLSRYTAKQSSALYPTDGDMIDWMYGRQRIFSFTFELYPRAGATRRKYYPPDEIIKRETRRNREAILYLMGKALCPYSALGKAASGRAVLVTGRQAGNDVDGGRTTVRSPRFRIPGNGKATLRLRYWLGHSASAGDGDGLRIHLTDASGARLETLATVSGNGTRRVPRWLGIVRKIPPGYGGQRLAIELVAVDTGSDAVVEVGVDQVRITSE
jgi:hypothetical protein